LSKIIQLDQHVADLIAAGEVVERPASVVKELLENSIDAGAGIVTVELIAGGMTFIRVTDNGCGIAPDDVKTAFLRHATSKLHGAEGLEAIGTLGFRGEALAAIAAVSRIELLTREPGASEGVSLSLEAGSVSGMSPAGCPEGTTIIIRDLFFNTPARLKFMKSDRAESSAIAATVLRCALSHPEVSVRLIRDGKTEYHTPGDSRLDSCIYSLLGRDFSAGLIETNSSDESVTVAGFISAPDAARGNRSYQFFFVNGRPIRSLTLQAALEQAFANTLPSGRFPSCVLHITTNPGNVEVNVHPAKTEIKFVSDKQFFDGVYYAALGALDRRKATVNNADRLVLNAEFGTPEPGTKRREQWGSGAKTGSGFKSLHVDEYRKKFGSGDPGAGSSGVADSRVGGFRAGGSGVVDSRVGGSGVVDSNNRQDEEPQLFQEPFRVIGEALKTYIIVEYKNSVWFIDKHAAHERIHFDALKSGDFEPMSQALITPVVCRHGREEVSVLLDNADLLDKLGFTVESFGDDAIAVRRIPDDIDIGDTEPVLSEICAELMRGGSAESMRRDNIYSSIACKAAIKAGKSSTTRELESLASKVLSGQVAQCPHGRPVAFEIKKAALDKGFLR